MDITIRDINAESDAQGIRAVHGEDEHWGSDRACYLSLKTRLENGFFIQVATLNDKIVGHAEWVISDEPDCKFLYLGMLQVAEDCQRRGIGSKLLESGAECASANNCAFLRTMPNTENGSVEFYHKNGFIRTVNSNSTLKLPTTNTLANSTVCIESVPFAIVKSVPFMVGLYQHSSAHIWNVYNARSEIDSRTVYSYVIGESYINIGAFGPSESASVTCWSKQLTAALIAEILAVGGGLGFKYLNFCVLNESVPCFSGFDYEFSDEHDIFIERDIFCGQYPHNGE